MGFNVILKDLLNKYNVSSLSEIHTDLEQSFLSELTEIVDRLNENKEELTKKEIDSVTKEVDSAAEEIKKSSKKKIVEKVLNITRGK